MHFYSMGYTETMALPLKTFWFLSGNVDRLMAREDMRTFGVATAAQSTQEYATSYHNRLVGEIGTVMKLKMESPLEAKRDEEGFNLLKRMAS